MKQYPVGSVVVFIPPSFAQYVGREGTIVEGLGMHLTVWGEQEGYVVHVQGEGETRLFSRHEAMRLKKFPPDLHGDCEEFMRKVLTPVEETA